MLQISFFIPPEAIPGRIGMLLTLFLCMINTLNSVARDMPKASGATTALVDWIIACLVFIIFAIVEYASLLVISRHNKRLDEERAESSRGLPEQAAVKRASGKHLDKISVHVLPIVFLIFSVIFWGVGREQPRDNPKDYPCME